VLDAPVVFVLENNQYAYSTPLEHQARLVEYVSRADAYGIPGVQVDGNDILAVRDATVEAVARARRGEGPTLIECLTMRMRGHAIHDPADYVPDELLAQWEQRDPIRGFETELRQNGVLDDPASSEIDQRIRSELEEAIAWAEASPLPDPATLEDGVFAE
jgi:pyruvate dehydrogenase E1 component alpha subunit